ncbi:hypothetical protein T484DRAFT_1811155 [Baffinella frigidus]|nr:hypothetical protein T484DRAFT_1811155 [Cryptophyta sp. CCMP2293]
MLTLPGCEMPSSGSKIGHAGDAAASDRESIDPSDIVVHSHGGADEVLEILQRIKDARDRASTAAGLPRTANDLWETGERGPTKGEFDELVARVVRGEATPVLRKLFLYQGACNVMQEIWIEDKGNPLAAQDPLKEWTVLHLHHHAGVGSLRQCNVKHTEHVDSVNARHLAAKGRAYQGDNPFFDTYIEPSDGSSLKVYPEKKWKCRAGLCGASNPPWKPVCWKCRTGTRPCVVWKWKTDRSVHRSAGIATILEKAEQAALWPSGGAEDRDRGVVAGGDASGASARGFRLGDLIQRYREVGEEVGAHGGSAAGGGVQPGASTLLSAEAAEELTRQSPRTVGFGVRVTGHAGVHEPAGGAVPRATSLLSAQAADAALSDSASSDEWHEAGESFEEGGGALQESAGVGSEGAACDGGHAPSTHGGDQMLQGEWIEDETLERDGWGGEGGAVQGGGGEQRLEARASGPAFGAERPDPPPSTFTVLFVGANVGEQTKLKLEKEHDKMRTAFLLPRGEEAWKGLAHFEPDCLATASKLSVKLMRCKPTVVHFACHGETGGLYVGGFLENEDLADFILEFNAGLGEQRIRLVVVNACMSGELARMLSEMIEFVVGHGELPVRDDDAIEFSTTLFSGLGTGLNLLQSFKAAKMASTPYELLAPRFDPRHFFLRGQAPLPDAAPSVPAQSPAAKGGGGGQLSSAEEAAERDARWKDLCSFLNRHGVYEMDARLRDEVGVHSWEQLAYVRDEDLQWLPVVQRRVLVDICKKVAGDKMSPGFLGDDDEGSVVSSADTLPPSGAYSMESDGESDGENERPVVVAARNQGSPGDFGAHFRSLVAGRRGDWTYCMLLLKAFMGEVDCMNESARVAWSVVLCEPASSERQVLDCFMECTRSDQFRHHFLDEWKYADFRWLSSKDEILHPHTFTVFVVGKMVLKVLGAAWHARWTRDVVQNWFSNDEEAHTFFGRANDFLLPHISYQAIGAPVQTRSYCAFLSMSKLTALILFEVLDMRKRLCRADARELGLAGFRLLVSSDGRVFHVAGPDAPCPRSLRVVHAGVRCLARLPRDDLDALLVPVQMGEAAWSKEGRAGDEGDEGEQGVHGPRAGNVRQGVGLLENPARVDSPVEDAGDDGPRLIREGLLGDALGSKAGEGSGECGLQLHVEDGLRAAEDRVREVEEELREERGVVAELRALLAQAEAAGRVGEGWAAAKGEWETSEEFRGKLREVFDKMDLNKDGAVDAEERAAASDLLNKLHMEFGLRGDVVFEGAVTYEAFEARHVREWEVVLKEQALAGVNLLRVVAEQLPGGSPETPLAHLQGMSGEQLQHFCRTSVASGVGELLRQQQEALREGRGRGSLETIEEQGNSKFAQGGGVLKQARFGELKDFTTGLLEKIGLPEPRLMEAINPTPYTLHPTP